MSLFQKNGDGKVFIKVCGVTNISDVKKCSEMKVDCFGIILEKPGMSASPTSDRISIERAKKLVCEKPKNIKATLLVHSIVKSDILALSDYIMPDALQFQSNISSEQIFQIKKSRPALSLIRTLRISAQTTLAALNKKVVEDWSTKAVDGFVLDSERGGGGQVHDWGISKTLVEDNSNIPMLLAGGLNATNINSALQIVKPFGIDVMSSLNGIHRSEKDHQKITKFVTTIRKIEN